MYILWDDLVYIGFYFGVVVVNCGVVAGGFGRLQIF